MEREGEGGVSTVVGAEPDDVFWFGVSAGDDTVPLVFVGVPGEVVSAFFEAVFVDFYGGQGEDEVVFCDGAIMDHAGKGCFVPALFCLFPVFVDGVNDDVAASVVSVASGLVAVADHFSSVWIELGVCGKSGRLYLAIEVVATDCFEGDWIHGEWWAIFLHCEKNTPPEDYVGI